MIVSGAGVGPNDAALVKLPYPITLTSEVNTVCLPELYDSFSSNTHCFVTGWGTSETGESKCVVSCWGTTETGRVSVLYHAGEPLRLGE